MRINQKLRIVAPGKSPAERQREWRARHPLRAKEVRHRRRVFVRQLVAKYKSDKGCERCHTTDARVLDLHHRSGDEKILAVSQMLYCKGWSSVSAEIKKCRVLCANCHRIEHCEESAQIAPAGFFRAS